MKLLPDHPLQKPALLFGFGLIVCLVFIFLGNRSRTRAREELDRLQRQIQFSQAGAIAPSASSLENLTAVNEQLLEFNALLDGRLFGSDSSTAFSGDSTSAYFELASFVEELNQRFMNLGIQVGEGERFGFSQFEQEGPDPQILDAVMAQKKAALVVMDVLCDARPISLTSLKREFLEVTAADPSVLQQAVEEIVSRSRFPEDTLMGVDKIEGFESYTFELSFDGYTESLRLFLKGLLSARLPVLVNDLRVEPLDRFEEPGKLESATTSNNPFDVLASVDEKPAEDGPVPIILNNLSSFHLRLEVFLGEEVPSDS